MNDPDFDVITIGTELPVIIKMKQGFEWNNPDTYILFKFSEQYLEKHINEVNWFYASCLQNLSESFRERHKDLFLWEVI